MLRMIFRSIGIALLAAACAQPGGVSLSAAEQCTQSGGVWRSGSETCERSAGGGGGY